MGKYKLNIYKSMKALYLVCVVLLASMVISQAPVTKPAAKKVLKCEQGTDKVWRVERVDSSRRLQSVVSYPYCPCQYTYTEDCPANKSVRRLQAVVSDKCEVDGYICCKNHDKTKKCAEITA